MNFYTVLSVLQLSAAVTLIHAHDGPVDFGRTLHVNNASIKRLRDTSSKASKVFFVAEEIKVATELAAEVTSDVAAKTGMKRGFNILTGKSYKSNLDASMPYLLEDIHVNTGAKAPKVFKPQVDYFSSDYVLQKSTDDVYFSYDYVLPKSDKVVENFSYDFLQSKSSKTYVSDILSYDFAGSSTDAASMSFDFTSGQPPLMFPTLLPTASWIDGQADDAVGDKPSGTNLDVSEDITNEGEEPALDSFGRLVFEYLSQCSGANLVTDSCLVSGTIYYLTSYEFANDGTGALNKTSGRFLQSMGENECIPPEVDVAFLEFIVNTSKKQCDVIQSTVSETEYEDTLKAFTTIFDSKSCWASLCDESSNPSDLFFKILFEEAAKCAGVIIDDVPQCVLNHIFDMIFMTDDVGVGRVRRALQESSSCEPPTTSEIGYFVTFLLTEAVATCGAAGVNIDATDLDNAFDSLIKIFGASKCWGVEECEENDDNHSSNADDFTDDDDEAILTIDGTRCYFEQVNATSLRAIDLTYFYILETASTKEEDALASLEAIERSFVLFVCGIDTRRSLEDTTVAEAQVYADISTDPKVVAVDSNPLDMISTDYGCKAKSSDALGCMVIEGTLSLLVPSWQDVNLDADIMSRAYNEELGNVFANLRVDDPNIIAVEYIGQDTTSLSSPENLNAATGSDESNTQSVSALFTSILIGLSGSLVAMAVLFVGLNRVKKTAEDPIHPDEKAVDDDSDAHQTSDITYSNSCDDRSELSSLSPTNRYSPEHVVVVNEPAKKHFILAENEEANWRRLGISGHVQATASLEEVYEEDSVVEEQSI
ncbi:hypothetical protein HJC23_013259 [Cyclotella cryptica]|uniref:Uncharacterized protein n=1 Tax=Cyclotella cryptica TaxID=29204 RepID=A0ABD3PG37_9STRA